MNCLLTDCHAHISKHHLTNNGFKLKTMLDRCVQMGVGTIYLSLFESELAWIEEVEGASRDHRVDVRITLGIEPPSLSRGLENLGSRLEVAIAMARQLADTGRIRAVGETGLDYYWPVVNFLQLQGLDRSDIERTMAENRDELLHEAPVKKALRIQRLVFARCIELAKELGLPLVIHEREALTDTMELLDKCRIPPDQVMFHCFGHGKSEAAAVLKAGYWISLPSSLGFRDPFREVAEDIPLERLLLETDSPYHSPVPGLWKQARALAQQEQLAKGTRGKEKEKLLRETGRNHFVKSVEEHFPGLEFTFREGKASVPAKTYFIESSDNRRINEPAFIRSSAMSMALIRKQPLKDICRITSENASHFYRL